MPLTGFDHLINAESACRIQEPERCLSVSIFLDDQIFANEHGDCLDDVAFRQVFAGDHPQACLHAGGTQKDGHLEQHMLLAASQQVEAPADHLAQCAMTLRPVGRHEIHHLEVFAQKQVEIVNAENGKMRAGNLDRQRYPIEPPADLGDAGQQFFIGQKAM